MLSENAGSPCGCIWPQAGGEAPAEGTLPEEASMGCRCERGFLQWAQVALLVWTPSGHSALKIYLSEIWSQRALPPTASFPKWLGQAEATWVLGPKCLVPTCAVFPGASEVEESGLKQHLHGMPALQVYARTRPQAPLL